MANFELPHFGQLDTTALKEYYEVNIDFNGSTIEVDLNFENKTIVPAELEKVKRFIDRLDKFEKQNKKSIRADYHDEEGDTVRDYLSFLLEEVGAEELAKTLGIDVGSAAQQEVLLEKLKLVRVGIYPDSEDHFGIFDYSIGEEIVNHLVVLFTDENGKLDYLTMES